MKQAIHIFRKDLQSLWYPLAVALTMQAVFVYFEARAGWVGGIMARHGPNVQIFVDLLLPVAWWHLIIQLVHQEPLVGDRQFWVTRPYRWTSLLAAKVLFIAAFINVPVLVGDVLILNAHGFSLAHKWPALLWRQVPFSIVLLLPPLALGSISRNTGQVILIFLLIVLRIVAGILVSSETLHSVSLDVAALGWIDNTAIAAALCAVLVAVIWAQYRTRRTWLARAVLAAFLLCPAVSIPFEWQPALQARVKPPQVSTTGIELGFDSTRRRRQPLTRNPDMRYASIAIPMRAVGLPPGTELVSSRARLTIDGENSFLGASLERAPDGYWETIWLSGALFEQLRNHTVDLRIEPLVTVVRQSDYRTLLKSRSMRVPQVGFCESSRLGVSLDVECRWALHAPSRTRVVAEYVGRTTTGAVQSWYIGDLSDSPFRAELGLSPVHSQLAFNMSGNDLADAERDPAAQFVFQRYDPLAHFLTRVDIHGIRLDDFAILEPAH
jgi:hypothetical protein